MKVNEFYEKWRYLTPPHFILLLFVFSISSIYLRNYPYLSTNNFRFLTKHWRSKHRPWFNLVQVIQWFYLHYGRTFYHHISYSSVRKQQISLLNSENKLWGNLCSNRIRKLIEKLLGASLSWGNIEWWKRSTDEIFTPCWVWPYYHFGVNWQITEISFRFKAAS